MMRLLSALLLSALLLPLTATAAEPAPTAYQEGLHYVRLATPVRPRMPGKIEVVELFSYACVHCYHFEEPIGAWRKTLPADVDFWRSHVTWNSVTELYARAFYTAQALGALDKISAAMFRAIHVDNKPPATRAKLAELFAANGIARETFDKTFNSFGIDSQVQQAGARARSFELQGTPEMVVAGKYRVTGNGLGSQAEVLKVVDYLVELERKARAAKPQ